MGACGCPAGYQDKNGFVGPCCVFQFLRYILKCKGRDQCIYKPFHPPPLELARCQALNLNDDGQQLNNPYFPILDPIAIWIEKKSML